MNQNYRFLAVLLSCFVILYFMFNHLGKKKEISETSIFNDPQFNSMATIRNEFESPQSFLQTQFYSLEQKNLRKEALKRVEEDRKGLLKAANGTDHKAFYKAVKPEVFCEKNERIGYKGDGGKQVCNAGAVKKEDCTLLSLGLHNQIDYDLAIFKATGRHCKLLGADMNSQNAKTQKSYEEMGGEIFVGKIPANLTIPEMLEKTGRSEVELLKIDIEGGEVDGLEPLIRDYYVCQIFIELHGKKPIEHLTMLRMMSRYGFRLFNIEPNPYCKKCCEYSLINELCMVQFGAVPLGITIPH
ncbi:hypothetical protein GCK72_012528 [Caenorhabditis remanei]|uniref:Methyltransferase FkbM domain-containing protein n=1 Tax=Caenorhabditis remanei TaxID=31234 RepID=A0A6A5GND4_CAERE|nr:hypothetical protein GCK72_012528 [Caenorhabditis remanei]KAF1756075.1 hypothetical protein GCK72_012528 [Caenorhabditis remanei]